MVDECKQSTTTSTTHAKKNFLVNTFHGGLKAWMDLYRHCVCPGSYLNYAFSIYVAKLRQLNRGIPSRSWRYLICIITRGLCSYNARLLNDDVSAIKVYWRRREFPNYARLHHGRMRNHAHRERVQNYVKSQMRCGTDYKGPHFSCQNNGSNLMQTCIKYELSLLLTKT